MAADWVYQNISTVHQQVVAQLQAWGAKLSPEDLRAIEAAFQNVQAHATDSSAWAAVQNAHMVSGNAFVKGMLPGKPTQAQLDNLENAFRTMDSWIPGPGNVLKTIGNDFHDVVTSKAWTAIAAGAAFIPGVGPEISAGMGAAYLAGKAMEGSDETFAAAGQAVQQYGGDDYKAGFDIGLGVTKGIMSSSSAQTARAAMSPEGQKGFDAALAVAAGQSIALKNPNVAQPLTAMSGTQKAAYLATHGLILSQSPAAVKQSTAKLLASSSEGESGMRAALSKYLGREIHWIEWLWQEMKNVAHDIFTPSKKTVITVKGETVK